MHNAVNNMLKKYNCRTNDEYINALKEIIQEIALLGLYRNNFFEKAAFYGGTSLRIFYGLDRFSEDLDFSLLNKNRKFNLEPFCKSVKNELQAFGFEVEVTKKNKISDFGVESAFIKGESLVHLIKIGAVKPPVSGIHQNEVFKVKFEVDTDPPLGARYDVKYLLTPLPFHIRIFSLSSLFAGKIHALLCRNWKGKRIKGRDLYDYVWYLSQNIPVNIFHLQSRMQQSGHFEENLKLDIASLYEYLDEKFKNIDYDQAKLDVLPFITNLEMMNEWSYSFFSSITKDRLKEDEK